MRRADMDGWPVFPRIKHATAREFYERLEQEGAELPVLDCELNFEFSGCYTTQTLIKKANRYAEKKLVDAEVASALSWACGAKGYPGAALEEGWRDTLFSHFHDILPGSGVHDTRTYTHLRRLCRRGKVPRIKQVCTSIGLSALCLIEVITQRDTAEVRCEALSASVIASSHC